MTLASVDISPGIGCGETPAIGQCGGDVYTLSHATCPQVEIAELEGRNESLQSKLETLTASPMATIVQGSLSVRSPTLYHSAPTTAPLVDSKRTGLG